MRKSDDIFCKIYVGMGKKLKNIYTKIMQTTEVHSIMARIGHRTEDSTEWVDKPESGMNMAGQNRRITVLFSLIASMTIGALVLMALDHNGPSAAAYSLSSYLRLDPVEEVVRNTIHAEPVQWGRIEVVYSYTSGGNSEELALLTGLADGGPAEFHFVVCNGNGGNDGQIQADNRWESQQCCGEKTETIRVCVISDRQSDTLTASQRQRTNALVESLSRTFDINPRKIRYPLDWQM